MSEDNRHIDLIEQYLNGKLIGEELAAFERRLDTDPEFAAEVSMHRTLVEGIEEARKQELKNFIANNAKVRSIAPAYSRYMVAAAAMLVFAVGIYLTITRLAPEHKDQLAENKHDAHNAEQQSKEDDSSSTINALQLDKKEEVIPAPPTVVQIEDEPQEEGLAYSEDIEPKLKNEVKEDFDEYDVVEDFTMDNNAAPPSSSIESLDAKRLPARNAEAITSLRVAKDSQLFDTIVTMAPYTVTLGNTDDSYSENTSYMYSSAPNYTSTGIYKITLDSFKWEADSGSVSTKDDPQYVVDGEEVKDKEIKKPQAIEVNIQFWKSPINYKGYRFDGKKLILYGIDQQTKVYVYKLDGDWYMKMGDNYYVLLPDNQFRAYKLLTDKTIINLFEE